MYNVSQRPACMAMSRKMLKSSELRSMKTQKSGWEMTVWRQCEQTALIVHGAGSTFGRCGGKVKDEQTYKGLHRTAIISIAQPMDSPFQDILHTNAVPTDAECDRIRDFLQGPRKELVDLSHKITQLQSLLYEATHRRDELQEFVSAHLALVSPFRRLPDDIIRQIFIATHPSTRNPSLSSDEPPLVLCRTCKSWRNLALTTPRLWASMHIVVAPLKLAQLVKQVTTWLDRSGVVPLDISLAFSREADPTSDISSLLSLLIAVSRRWRNIQLVLASYPQFASLSPDDVPLLQSIVFKDRIDRFDPHMSGDTIGPFVFLGTKSLRSLECGNIDCIFECPISWGTLTHLTALDLRPSLTDNNALRLLRQCQRLETCMLEFRIQRLNRLNRVVFADNTPISLPRLRHLSIKHQYDYSGGTYFFDKVALPTLRSFHCEFSAGSLPTDPLRFLFPSSMDHLECLKVEVKLLPSEVLLAALAAMPFLEELHIVGEPIDPSKLRDPEFLNHLIPGADSVSVLCPRLRRIELSDFGMVSDETILEFILSRTGSRLEGTASQNVVQLARFSCTLQRYMQHNILLDLGLYQSGGCVVDLKYDGRTTHRSLLMATHSRFVFYAYAG
ncbi:hypothetical protein B0H12DRAFT_1218759 [Mycena haematopus]|nr:hypothetical protein B0H12DRAFT_1218759 [Mycena haematopus]